MRRSVGAVVPLLLLPPLLFLQVGGPPFFLLASFQLGKNVILVNKGSVIHSADGDAGVHPVQVTPPGLAKHALLSS